MRFRTLIHSTVVSSTLAAVLLAGCQGNKTKPVESASIHQELTRKATVTAVDPATREVTLSDEQGRMFAVVCGPEVRNFDQIDVGDTLTARYKEELSVRLIKSYQNDTEAASGMAVGRAEAGAKPGMAIGAGTQMTVVVQTVDKKEHMVTFTDPAGMLHAVRAERTEGQAFVDNLKKGDRVEITYGESLALSMQ